MIVNDDTTSDSPVTPGMLPLEQNAAISLPATLFERVDQENVGVFFAFYETATLFPVGGQNTISDGNTSRQTQVGSQVVAATIDSNQELTNLENPVTIVFRLQINTTTEVRPTVLISLFPVTYWLPDGLGRAVIIHHCTKKLLFSTQWLPTLTA